MSMIESLHWTKWKYDYIRYYTTNINQLLFYCHENLTIVSSVTEIIRTYETDR